MRRGLLAAVTLAGCAAAAPVPPPPEPGAARDRCERERARALELTQDGRIARALRVLEAADVTCPETASTRAQARVALEAALNSGSETGLTLVRAGLAKAKSDAAAAQRQLDRALVRLRKETGVDERVVLFERRYPPTWQDLWELEGVALPLDAPYLAVVDPSRPLQVGHLFERDRVQRLPGGRRLLKGEPDRLLTTLDAEPVAIEPLAKRAFAPDGRHVVGVASNTLVVIDGATGRRVGQRPLAADFQVSRFVEIAVTDERVVLHGYRPGAVESALVAPLPTLAAPLEVRGDRVVVPARGSHAAAWTTTQSGAGRLVVHALGAASAPVEVPCQRPLLTVAGMRVALSDDGRYAAAQVTPQAVELIDVAHGTTTLLPNVTAAQDAGQPVELRFTEDGAYLCAGTGENLHVVEVEKRRRLGPAWRCVVADDRAHVIELPLSPGHALVTDLRSSSSPIALSEDKKTAIAVEAKGDAAPRHLLIFDPVGRQVRHRIALPLELFNIWLAVRRGVAEVSFFEGYDVETGRPTAPRHAEPPRAELELDRVLPATKGGWRVQLAGSTVVWQREEAFHAWRLPKAGTKVMSDAACGVAASANGRFVAATPACNQAGTLRVWDMEDGRVVGKVAVSRSGEVVAVDDEGRRVAYASKASLEVVTLATGARVAAPLEAEVLALALSPDGQWLAVRDRGELSLRSLDAPATVRWAQGFGLGVSELRFFADGERVGVLDALLDTASGAWTTDTRGLRVVGGGVESFLAFAGKAEARWHEGGAPLTLGESTQDGLLSTWSLPRRGALLVDASGLYTPSGAVALHALPTGERRALMLPLERGAIVFLAGGQVDWLGAPALPGGLVCQTGSRVWPFRLCEERWLARGGLAKAWRGDTTYTEP